MQCRTRSWTQTTHPIFCVEIQALLKMPNTMYDAAITVITVQELFNGWVSRANEPKKQAVGEACA
jgi:hypothetical protein